MAPEEKCSFIQEARGLQSAVCVAGMPTPTVKRFWKEMLGGRPLNVAYGCTEIGGVLATPLGISLIEEASLKSVVPGLTDAESCGQTTASDEVLAALSLILTTKPQVFLVLDGIDECPDYEHLLELLREICTISSTKVLLLGRPIVELPVQFPHLSLYLDHSWNLPDIKLSIYPELRSLQDRRLIPASLDVEGSDRHSCPSSRRNVFVGVAHDLVT
ncbi:hypothetical protein BDW59DRAFT_157952 [Aspergillus cavernicola]|uniref:Nephrocystin 3-like N-terminal domain-containing protein n=1 Tax=Aspergillus cavernicola TaxID=176166 RepID=A0ABR4IUS1_9EURO